MSVDLDYDPGQQAIAETLAQFCRERVGDTVVKACSGFFPRELWSELAELGVLGLATVEGGGGALEVSAAMESLGRAVFPGPLVASFLATQVLPSSERQAVAAGEVVVSVGNPPLMPWAPCASLFLELRGEHVYRARPVGGVSPVDTLGGEPWGELELERSEELDGGARALLLSDLARAAYLAAAGQRVIDEASAHARTRNQFGRAIGEFQAVAHPLADCAMRLAAAAALARATAFHFDRGAEGDEDARRFGGAASLSARAAALEASHVGHQVFGAVGITLEGPIFHVTRRIRQLASQPPNDAGARAVLLRGIGIAAGAEEASP